MVQVNGNAPESTICLNYKTTKLALEVAIEAGITIKVVTTIKAVGTAATEIDEMEEVEEVVIAGEIQEVIATQIVGEIRPPISGVTVVVVDLTGHLEDTISNLHRHGLDVVVVIAAVVEDGEIKITHQMEVRLTTFICFCII